MSQVPAWGAITLLPPNGVGAQARPNLDFMSHGPVTVFHVAKSGSDANPGTADRPWRSVGKAMSTLTAGQGVYVHSGVYEERLTTTNAGTPSAPIWIMEAPGETAVIKGSAAGGGPFVRLTRPYWVVDGFEINANGTFAQAIRFDRTHHVVARNIDAHHGIGNAAVVFDAAQDAALISSKVHDYTWTEPNGSAKDSHGVAIYAGSQRILIRANDSWGHTGDDVQCVDADPGTSTDDPVDVTITGNRYGNTYPGGAVRVRTRENAVDVKTCRRVTVSTNKMFGFRAAGTAPGGAALVAHVGADSILVHGNRFWDNGLAASLGSQTNCCLGTVVFRRNLIFDSTR
jgi:hypothetical protein